MDSKDNALTDNSDRKMWETPSIESMPVPDLTQSGMGANIGEGGAYDS